MLKKLCLSLALPFFAATAVTASAEGTSPAPVKPEGSIPMPPPDRPHHGKIVGGIPVTEGLMPYQVSLFRLDSGHFCGGTLIAPNWVLTAAHCIKWMQDDVSFRVLVGTNDLLHGGQVYELDRVIVHEGYDPNTFVNDIALVKLAGSVSGRAAARARPLSPFALTTDRSAALTGAATVSGFGTTSEGGDLSNQLLMADVPLVPISQCNASGSYDGQIRDTMICAGGNTKDSCQGDSGGPLVYGDARRGFTLIGVVSWGEGCAREAKYGVYTRVASYTGWIRDTMNKNKR